MEGAEGKAGHRWGKMEEDVLLRRVTAQQRCGASAVGGGKGRKAETGNLRPERIRLPCTRALTEELAGPH